MKPTLQARARALSRYLALQETESYLPVAALVKGRPYALFARKSHVGIWRPRERSFLVWDAAKGRHLLELHWDCYVRPGPLGTGRRYGTAKPLRALRVSGRGGDEKVLLRALAAFPAGGV